MSRPPECLSDAQSMDCLHLIEGMLHYKSDSYVLARYRPCDYLTPYPGGPLIPMWFILMQRSWCVATVEELARHPDWDVNQRTRGRRAYSLLFMYFPSVRDERKALAGVARLIERGYNVREVNQHLGGIGIVDKIYSETPIHCNFYINLLKLLIQNGASFSGTGSGSSTVIQDEVVGDELASCAHAVQGRVAACRERCVVIYHLLQRDIALCVIRRLWSGRYKVL